MSSYCSGYPWSTYGESPYYVYRGIPGPGLSQQQNNPQRVAENCFGYSFNVKVCYELIGSKGYADLYIGDKIVDRSTVDQFTKSATLKGSLGDVVADIEVRALDIEKRCGRITGSVCKGTTCIKLGDDNRCLK